MDEKSLDHKAVYQSQAERYDRLVSREDYQQNIFRSLNRIKALAGLDMAELGAGTGRLTRLLAPVARSIVAFDISPAMLEVARHSLMKPGMPNWSLAVADNRSLPLSSGCVDLVISGWSICYLISWADSEWRAGLDRALGEIERLLRPGGITIILETQGTGFEQPHPPEILIPYYEYLESRGFSSTWIRTDYRFNSSQEAVELVDFFFDAELAAQVKRSNQLVLPECTGIWWKYI
jgi:ubiquinone/menaquinone biosynthesis C-methylase UbiE